jgi:Domain of unknown function (DUF3291)
MIVSVTRLRLRSLRFLLSFVYQARRSRLQAQRSDGCLGACVRETRGLTFWTLTMWADEGSLRHFLLTGAHRQVMPKLSHWCDEAAVARWAEEAMDCPTWELAAIRLAQSGRLSRVRWPSELHRNGRIDVS